MINTLLHVRIYMRVDKGRIETISATHKTNLKGIWLYKDNGKDTKNSLRKDEATSLGDVDCLPEMDWCLWETCTLLFKDVVSSRLWCLYIFPKTWKMPKDGPAVFLMVMCQIYIARKIKIQGVPWCKNQSWYHISCHTTTQVMALVSCLEQAWIWKFFQKLGFGDLDL